VTEVTTLWISRRFVWLFVAAVVSISGSAQADETWSWVKPTCAPELRMFSIHRFSVVDPRDPNSDLLRQKYGIYDSKSLKDQPFICTIPPLPAAEGAHPAANGYTVKVVGHLDEHSDATSLRLIQDDVEIFLDGRSLGIMGLNQYGITMDADWIQVTETASLGLFIDTCTIEDVPSTPDVDKRLACKFDKYEPAKP
jgi:hypothetical protein